MSLLLAAAADLAQKAAAFTHWRSTTPVGARIPTDLWAQAVALAARHGVSKVAATLRLDYAGLKRRLTALTPPAPVPSVAGLCGNDAGFTTVRAWRRADPNPTRGAVRCALS